MSEDLRVRRVRFASEKLFTAFKRLQLGRTEEKNLAYAIQRAIDDLKSDPCCGIRVSRTNWPEEYIQKYGITNLRKYNLPHAWRLIYTIVGDDIEVVSVILEWFSHSDYERRFGYAKN